MPLGIELREGDSESPVLPNIPWDHVDKKAVLSGTTPVLQAYNVVNRLCNKNA